MLSSMSNMDLNLYDMGFLGQVRLIGTIALEGRLQPFRKLVSAGRGKLLHDVKGPRR